MIPTSDTGKQILRISKWFLSGLTSATPATPAYPAQASGSPYHTTAPACPAYEAATSRLGFHSISKKEGKERYGSTDRKWHCSIGCSTHKPTCDKERRDEYQGQKSTSNHQSFHSRGAIVRRPPPPIFPRLTPLPGRLPMPCLGNAIPEHHFSIWSVARSIAS